jgi:hypothetical protein
MMVDGTLSIENFMLMIKKTHIAHQIFDCSCPVNWSTTKKCSTYIRGKMDFPIFGEPMATLGLLKGFSNFYQFGQSLDQSGT